MANVVNNYVEALYYSTNNSLDRTQIEKDLQKFVEISNDNSNLKKVLKDPRIENEVKFQIIDGIVQWFSELPRKNLAMAFKYN